MLKISGERAFCTKNVLSLNVVNLELAGMTMKT
jgi:hypothetical protein